MSHLKKFWPHGGKSNRARRVLTAENFAFSHRSFGARKARITDIAATTILAAIAAVACLEWVR